MPHTPQPAPDMEIVRYLGDIVMDTQRATSPRAEGEAQREAEREAQREAPGVFARGCALELAARHTGRPALLEYLLARQPRGESKARFEGQVGLRWGEGARGRWG